MMPRIDRVLSLGTTCETAFQIRRIFGHHNCISSVFDWQITPSETILEYLRRDFVGLFERDDLQEIDGVVRNVRYGTQHMHEFRAGLDIYETARSRHEHLCANVRNALNGRDNLLLVVTLPREKHYLGQSITEFISARNPDLAFRLEIIERRSIPELIAHWQGNDAEWTMALSAYESSPETMTAFVQRQAKRLARHIASGRF